MTLDVFNPFLIFIIQVPDLSTTNFFCAFIHNRPGRYDRVDNNINTIHALLHLKFQITYCYDKFTDETLSEHNPSTYLDLIDRVSFFFGSYGLFILLNVSVYVDIQIFPPLNFQHDYINILLITLYSVLRLNSHITFLMKEIFE